MQSNYESILIILNKSEVYFYLGKYDKALKYYKELVQIDKKTLSPNDLSIATPIHNIGQVYNHLGKYDKALKYFNESLGIFKKTVPLDYELFLFLNKHTTNWANFMKCWNITMNYFKSVRKL